MRLSRAIFTPILLSGVLLSGVSAADARPAAEPTSSSKASVEATPSLAKAAVMKTHKAYFYNVDRKRDASELNREIQALADGGPLLIGLSEAAGYRLPDIKGYQLFEDSSNANRDNHAAYVKNGYNVTRFSFIDLNERFGNSHKPGLKGPRSYMKFWIDGLAVVVFHQPPRYATNAKAAQAEGFRALVDAQASREKNPDRPRLAFGDMNARVGEPEPGVDDIARATGGKHHGGRIDAAATNGGIKVISVRYPSIVSDVRLKSDHDHALFLKFDVSTEQLAPVS